MEEAKTQPSRSPLQAARFWVLEHMFLPRCVEQYIRKGLPQSSVRSLLHSWDHLFRYQVIRRTETQRISVPILNPRSANLPVPVARAWQGSVPASQDL